MAQGEVVEKAVLLVVENALGVPRITKGTYQNLDKLALRGSSGYVSTFKGHNDIIYQMSGLLVSPLDAIKEDIGPIKLCVLEENSKFNEYGEIISIKGKSKEEITNIIKEKMTNKEVRTSVLVAQIQTLEIADFIVGQLYDLIDGENVAIAVISGYKDGAKVKEFPVPPVVNPSWKVVGPKVVEELSVEKPMMFIEASKALTRIDKVTGFDEEDVEKNFCMGCLPICQYFRQYSYYTGSSWKYGA